MTDPSPNGRPVQAFSGRALGLVGGSLGDCASTAALAWGLVR